MRTVVTGGAGFIGSHLVDALAAAGDEVHVVDNLSTGRRERIATTATLHRFDVADTEALRAMVETHGPMDRWFHMAAQADVRVSVDDPIADAHTNVLGTIAVLEAARANNAPVVFASTGGAIYGEVAPPCSESATEAPVSFYGAAKLAAEKYIETHARLYGLRHAIVRYANVYGPRQDPHGEAGVVAIFGGRAIADDDVTIYGDGRQTRDYVYVGDVVETTISAGVHATSLPDGSEVPVLNVGTGTETSVLELWEVIRDVAGSSAAYTLAPARAGEVQRSALDATHARSALGVGIDTPLRDGLARTIEWMRSSSS